ncbi:MAG: hypothetical protein P9M00_02490 [Candidatus Tritonobacter lacicola]|nr:hypothetical protein [Candidatus Tritonobacter lacicola]
MRDKEKLFIFFILLCCLSLFSCSALFNGMFEDVGETMVGAFKLSGIAGTYYAMNQQWPKDEEELRTFAQKNSLDFDWSGYSEIQFTPQADGSLIIEADLAPPNSGSWTGTVTVPKDNEQYPDKT